ncbi:hypothetical protein GGR54DRAFT_654402 [Hypoxylon sp. NC1633]|nr:hypothetical protein GGR54DRAFT_654402 [Hypoxylon sp. NC1633]
MSAQSLFNSSHFFPDNTGRASRVPASPTEKTSLRHPLQENNLSNTGLTRQSWFNIDHSSLFIECPWVTYTPAHSQPLATNEQSSIGENFNFTIDTFPRYSGTLNSTENDMSIEKAFIDTGATKQIFISYDPCLAGNSQLGTQSSDAATVDILPFHSPFWGSLDKEDGLPLDAELQEMQAICDAFRVETETSAIDDNEDGAYDTYDSLFEINEFAIQNFSDSPSEPDTMTFVNDPIDIDTIGLFNDSVPAEEIDWDMYLHEEPPDLALTASSYTQDPSGLQTESTITDLDETTTDKTLLVKAQQPRTTPEMFSHQGMPRGSSNATIKTVQLQHNDDECGYQYSWYRRKGVWEDVSNMAILSQNDLDKFVFFLRLEILVHSDGAAVWLIWDQDQEGFYGPDLIVPRTFRISLQDACSSLLNPEKGITVEPLVPLRTEPQLARASSPETNDRAERGDEVAEPSASGGHREVMIVHVEPDVSPTLPDSFSLVAADSSKHEVIDLTGSESDSDSECERRRPVKRRPHSHQQERAKRLKTGIAHDGTPILRPIKVDMDFDDEVSTFYWNPRAASWNSGTMEADDGREFCEDDLLPHVCIYTLSDMYIPIQFHWDQEQAAFLSDPSVEEVRVSRDEMKQLLASCSKTGRELDRGVAP